MKKMLKLTILIIGVISSLSAYNIPVIQKTCNDGDATACQLLGVLYATGEEVKQNMAKSIKYFEKSCDGDDGGGCTQLGALYYTGNGVKKNVLKSYEYLMKATKLGDENAPHNLYILCKSNPTVCKKQTNLEEEIPSYQVLISDKYVFHPGAGFYGKINEKIPRNKILFQKNSFDTGPKYVKLAIDKTLYTKLKSRKDYQKHLKVNVYGGNVKDRYVIQVPPGIIEGIVDEGYWYELPLKDKQDYICEPLGFGFKYVGADKPYCPAITISNMFIKK